MIFFLNKQMIKYMFITVKPVKMEHVYNEILSEIKNFHDPHAHTKEKDNLDGQK